MEQFGECLRLRRAKYRSLNGKHNTTFVFFK